MLSNDQKYALKRLKIILGVFISNPQYENDKQIYDQLSIDIRLAQCIFVLCVSFIRNLRLWSNLSIENLSLFHKRFADMIKKPVYYGIEAAQLNDDGQIESLVQIKLCPSIFLAEHKQDLHTNPYRVKWFEIHNPLGSSIIVTPKNVIIPRYEFVKKHVTVSAESINKICNVVLRSFEKHEKCEYYGDCGETTEVDEFIFTSYKHSECNI